MKKKFKLRFTIFGITFSHSKNLKERLQAAEEVGQNETTPELYNAVAGIYSGRVFGWCTYRNAELKKIAVGNSLVNLTKF